MIRKYLGQPQLNTAHPGNSATGEAKAASADPADWAALSDKVRTELTILLFQKRGWKKLPPPHLSYETNKWGKKEKEAG